MSHSERQHTATHCDILHYTATHCSTQDNESYHTQNLSISHRRSSGDTHRNVSCHAQASSNVTHIEHVLNTRVCTHIKKHEHTRPNLPTHTYPPNPLPVPDYPPTYTRTNLPELSRTGRIPWENSDTCPTGSRIRNSFFPLRAKTEIALSVIRERKEA